MKARRIFLFLIAAVSLKVEAQETFNLSLSNEFISKIQDTYIERQEIDPYILNSSPEGIFTLKEDSEIFTTFIDEGAGYRNTFGIFTLDEGSNYKDGDLKRRSIDDKQLLFLNASKVGSGGSLSAGDTISSGVMQAGTQFGFYLEADGYRRNHPHTYYSYTPFNSDGIKHSILAYDYDEDKLVLGFEDLYGGGDKDYNDLLITVFTNPVQSLRDSSSSERVANINGAQQLNSVNGMVRMTVASFGRIEMEEEIVLYPENLSQQFDVKFLGISEFLIESNIGVVVSTQITNLSNGEEELQTNYLLDGFGHTLYTAPSSTHREYHRLELNTLISDLSKIRSDEYIGHVVLTMSVY